MNRHEPLHPDNYYHIYGRGNNGESLFPEPRNYAYFLALYAKYITPVALTYAYCLMGNHYHLLVKIRPNPNTHSYDDWLKYTTLQFRNFFGTYAKAINKATQRTGALFESPFKRKHITNDRYFTQLVRYIHRNPQRHGFVTNFQQWKYFSYHAICSDRPTAVERHAVLDWFGGVDAFVEAHLWDDAEENILLIEGEN